MLRSPFAKRRPSPCVWSLWNAANCQTPARTGSSGQGSTPGEWGTRFSTWQAFDAEPMFTNIVPKYGSSPPSTTVLFLWSPVTGRPDTTVRGVADRQEAPGRQQVAHDLVVLREEEMAEAVGDAVAALVAEARGLVRVTVAVRVLQGEDAARHRAVGRVRKRDVERARGRERQVSRAADVVGDDRRAEAVGERDAAVVRRALDVVGTGRVLDVVLGGRRGGEPAAPALSPARGGIDRAWDGSFRAERGPGPRVGCARSEPAAAEAATRSFPSARQRARASTRAGGTP